MTTNPEMPKNVTRFTEVELLEGRATQDVWNWHIEEDVICVAHTVSVA